LGISTGGGSRTANFKQALKCSARGQFAQSAPSRTQIESANGIKGGRRRREMCTRRDEWSAMRMLAMWQGRGDRLTLSLRVQIGLVAAAPEERKWPNLNGRSF
jgi:hypothetical protein